MQIGDRPVTDFDLAAVPRWDGTRERMEVWYLTASDPATGTGLWIHNELVCPDDTGAYQHGWIAVFPPDDEPSCERFGPTPATPRPGAKHRWFDAPDSRMAPGHVDGSTAGMKWDLTWTGGTQPLWTFPRLAWSRELLPGAQCLPVPSAPFTGWVDTPTGRLRLEDAPGGVAHIYGHGSAREWVWLHADLGGGDVLEVVSGVSRTRALNLLPPTAFVRLRHDGRDWPAAALPALRTNTTIGLPDWSVVGSIGRHRIRIEVHQPPDRSVALSYTDPDGGTATCTNSERASAEIVVETRSGRRWQARDHWHLDGTAHAEVGTRP